MSRRDQATSLNLLMIAAVVYGKDIVDSYLAPGQDRTHYALAATVELLKCIADRSEIVLLHGGFLS